ncbi:dihydroxyacetone kinase [Mycolicibacterium conceptionense]|uniref:Dihydroxyacetone kinase n=1 Tax=Mycolicibacterium conceptionense TaxID=451644 RepID=A0A0U1DB09_9MYCO|nr:dihydroxyacetone kinase [Mycolicibacterium conceptionense]
MSARRLDGPALRAWAHTAVDDLISHTDEINRLNVFPVADADTGTNMLFTMRSAWAHIDAEPVDGDIPALASALAAGALQGARGNSGVILSQILLGLAEAITNAAARRDGDLPMVDAALLGAALRHAAALAGTSMGEPVPGTIVSVLEAAAQAAERCAAEGGDVADAAAAAGDAAATALDRTPEQLDVLAKAGVVDSGGRGLLVLLDAMTATLVGHAPRRPVYAPSSPQAPPAPADLAVADAPPQFEVMYLLTGCGAPAVEGLRAALEQMGESVAIAASGNDQYSVHVHLDDAGARGRGPGWAVRGR